MNYSSENSKSFSPDTDRVMRCLIKRGITISVMESCTGGLVSSYLTDTEGASSVFPGGFVTYSNEAKIRNGVPEDVIERYGVYSAETAEAMAEACRSFYCTDMGIGITGSTGNPDPRNADSVPGEVFFAILWGEEKYLRHMSLDTDGISRHELRMKITAEVAAALAMFLDV